MIVVLIIRHDTKYATLTPATIGTAAWRCCVDSSAKAIEASSAREAPANIAVMPTSAPTRGSMPACGAIAITAAVSSQPSPLPNVSSGASVPPEVPLPSAIAHDTNFAAHERGERSRGDLARRARRRCCRSRRRACAADEARRSRRRRTAPIAGHHIQWIGSVLEPVLDRVDDPRDVRRDDPDDATGEGRDDRRSRRSAAGTSGIANTGDIAVEDHAQEPRRPRLRARPARSSARLYSNSNSSIASSIAAIGVPKIAVMPAAAPAASSVLRSAAVTWISWPSAEPSAPPVAMIGPSAPNGPPVPIAIAADVGLRNVIFSGIRLSLVRICSIASGMPWPRIAREP